MKTIPFYLLVVFFTVMTSGSYGSKTDAFFYSDDFSSPSTWQSQGDGSVYIGNGMCNFDEVYCGDYNRVYKYLEQTINTYNWRAECDFTILNANPDGYGTGEVIMAFTAGTQDFMSYNASQAYEETWQDGLAVALYSESSTDNDIDHWYFMIEAKKGNVRTFDTDAVIYADASISTYYIRLERITPGLVQLSVYSDPEHTVPLPGSPVSFAIDPTIDRLNTVQHGTMTPGYYSRLINGVVDNDLIYYTSLTGIAENVSRGFSGFTVYPNPASSRINVSSDSPADLDQARNYKIFDISGKEVASEFLDRNRQIDVSELVKGVFIIMITGAEKTFWSKFQKID